MVGDGRDCRGRGRPGAICLGTCGGLVEKYQSWDDHCRRLARLRCGAVRGERHIWVIGTVVGLNAAHKSIFWVERLHIGVRSAIGSADFACAVSATLKTEGPPNSGLALLKPLKISKW